MREGFLSYFLKKLLKVYHTSQTSKIFYIFSVGSCENSFRDLFKKSFREVCKTFVNILREFNKYSISESFMNSSRIKGSVLRHFSYDYFLIITPRIIGKLQNCLGNFLIGFFRYFFLIFRNLSIVSFRNFSRVSFRCFSKFSQKNL